MQLRCVAFRSSFHYYGDKKSTCEANNYFLQAGKDCPVEPAIGRYPHRPIHDIKATICNVIELKVAHCYDCLNYSMNYLAHAYLSFGNEYILLGNMSSDFIKGRKQYDYPIVMQKGIRLHRLIDTFTDAHEATRQSKAILKPAAGAYAGAFTDVVYDHFLAADTKIFPNSSLQLFAENTYHVLHKHIALLPERFRNMVPYMSKQNWLYNYCNMYGIQNSFEGIARRAKYFSESSTVFELFTKHYIQLQKCYETFMPDIKSYAENNFNLLLQDNNTSPTEKI